MLHADQRLPIHYTSGCWWIEDEVQVRSCRHGAMKKPHQGRSLRLQFDKGRRSI